MSNRFLRFVGLLTILLASVKTLRAQTAGPTVIDASKFVMKNAVVYRDKRTPGGKAAVLMFPRGPAGVAELIQGKTPILPPGDYRVTAWIEAVPVSLQPGLSIRISAGGASRTVAAVHLQPAGYTPITFHLLHRGGAASFSISASSDSSFPGMRAGQAAEEKAYAGAKPKIEEFKERKPDPGVDNLEIEELKDLSSLKFDDTRLDCDRLEFTPIRLSNALVTDVDVDKVHYLPGETVNANCTIESFSADAAGPAKLIAELVNEVDHHRTVFEKDLQLESGKPLAVTFNFKLDDTTEFGHELRCTLTRNGQAIHSNDQVFGVSKNVYRVGITGSAGPQDRSHYTEKDADATARANKAAYANYFECFAWAPCDYCNLTPKTESFFSGQTEYHGSVSGFKNLLSAAHKYGIKGFTYGKNAACGLSGAEMFMRHPNWFGGGSGDFDSFYIERMFYDEYLMDDGEGHVIKWQHWPNWWVDAEVPAALDFGCDEIVRSSRMLGWDGVRWDGHHVGHMDHFNARLTGQIPNFISGYNIALANIGSPVFLPTLPVADFHQIAKNHGMMMDESVRDWTLGGGQTRPFYDSICREADYEKRIGGLPLFIMFDRASRQDSVYNVLWGLAAGERYTYATTVGDFAAGPLTRFLTRYSAFIWDDTARVKDPAKIVHLAPRADEAANLKPDAMGNPAGPWFDQSTWLRKLPDGHQQLLVNIVNPPNYPAFCNRVQTPSTPLHHLGVKVDLPAGAKLVRAMHVSIDNSDGLTMLDATADAQSASVVLPELRLWSIIIFEFAPSGEKALAYPGYELTTPIEDAAKFLADQDKKAAIAADQAAKTAASGVANAAAPVIAWQDDYAHTRNIDLENEKKVVKPFQTAVVRNGVLDVTHVKGMYGWLNPVDNSIGLLGGGNLRSVYANHAGWRVGPEGCLENFPASYNELLSQDVVILDNSLATDVGNSNRVRIADFVRDGGGLLVLGGGNSLSCGNDHNTYVGDILPIKITGRRNTFRDDKGMAFAPVGNDIFSPGIEWGKIQAFTVDISALKEGAQVLATVAGHPAIVASKYGNGRVICVLANTEGDYGAGAHPYWLSGQWTQILADAIKWTAGDYRSITKIAATKRVTDPTKTIPMDLLLNADSMTGDEFTKRLNEARSNVVDAQSASTLIQAAADNSLKIMDKDLLQAIVEEMAPYIDDSFAPLAEKLLALKLDYFRVAGFTLLRHCRSPQSRPLLENGLREADPVMVREALAALAYARDPAAIPAIKQYLAQGGVERLLAMTALRTMGDRIDMSASLAEYVKDFNRVTALMAYRKSVFEHLHGGTSFKLTPAERRAAEREFARARRKEAEAIFDVTQFRATLANFTDAQAVEFTQYVTQSDNRAAASIAFAALPNLTGEQAKKFRESIAQAKLPQLRMLAEK
ncbi:MAG TPA: glutamine amidotransferase [Tepidisphaeraceae bacterium]|jgi:hypothetical protein|nr:glutamine amidotransferase [Tepidisphaeraceae bacterium]